AAIRHEGERHRSGQPLERIAGIGGADPEPADHDGDARGVGVAGRYLHRLGKSVGRANAVLGDLWQRAMARRLAEALVGWLVLRGAWNHHLLALAARAIDDVDGLAAGRRLRLTWRVPH